MSRISNFTEIHAVGVALKHVAGRTDRQIRVDMTKAIYGFRVNLNDPKNTAAHGTLAVLPRIALCYRNLYDLSVTNMEYFRYRLTPTE
jgi:hypothetical protein